MTRFGGALLCVLAPTFALAAGPLTLWHAYRGTEEEALRQSIELYTRKTGVPVELLGVPHDALRPKLNTSIPHGVGPDVFIYPHEALRTFERNGVVAPSDGLLDRAAYFENALDALTVGGKTYGFPLALKSLALYRNAALLPEPVRDTASLLAKLPAISRPAENRFGLAYEAGDFYFHSAFLFGFGGELFDAQGRAQFDTPAMARSLAFVKHLQDERLMPTEISGALVKSLFNSGRAGLVVSGPWFAGEVAPSVKLSIDPLPTVSETGLPLRSFLGVEAAFASSRSERLAEAQQLARFLSLQESAELRAVIGRQVPASLAVYERAPVKDDALIASFREAAKQAIPMPNTLEMGRVWEPMKLALRAVLQGGASPEQAGALADRRYRALHRQAPPTVSPWPYLLLAALALVGAAIVASRRGPREKLTFARRYPDLKRALVYVGPAAAGLLALVMVPFVVGISLSFFHHDAGRYTFVGFSNFIDILASRGYRISEPLSFYFTLVVTVGWTLLNVALHVSLGLAMAILLRDPLLKLRGVYRVLLIVPWAIPNYITALMWKGMFHRQFGAVNGVLALFGVEPVSWFTRFSTSFAANLATNTWLGFPFMMVVALGALQSIPQDLYEAAEVDGASRWVQFRRITLPLLRPALLPAVILGSVWTFNMFNIIYLVSGGEPGGATDILVSEAYRWAFQRNEQYGFAAAYSVLIFFVLLAWTQVTKRMTRATEEMMG